MNRFPKGHLGRMRYRSAFSATSLILFSLFAWCAAAGQSPSPLSFETQIPMPDVKGRIDHLSVDVKGGSACSWQLSKMAYRRDH